MGAMDAWFGYKRRRDRRRLRITGSPPAGTINEAYEWEAEISGGLAPYAIENVGEALPDGLSFIDATLSGTPTEAGEFLLALKVTDANGVSIERSVYLVIEA